MKAKLDRKKIGKRTRLLKDLTAMIQKYGPDSKLPTVRQLCGRFSVSSATLDRVLGEMEEEHLIVRRHAQGIFVSSKLLQKKIAVVFGPNVLTAASPFWRLVVRGIQQLARKQDLYLRAYLDLSTAMDSIASYEDFIQDLERGRLHGILLPNLLGREQIARFRNFGLPMVMLGFASRDPWTVNLDFTRAIELGVSELASKDCCRIGLISAHGVFANSEGDPFAQALAERGLACEGRWRSEIVPECTVEDCHIDPFEKAGYQAIRSWIGGAFFDARIRANGEFSANLPMAELPDGILIMDDFMARGAIHALTQAGLRPGTDVHLAVLTNRGSNVLGGQAGNFITLETDPLHFARALLEMLCALMNGARPPDDRVLIAPFVAKAVTLQPA